MEATPDFALQCSPDHPWGEKHPEWVHHRAVRALWRGRVLEAVPDVHVTVVLGLAAGKGGLRVA
ncbi:hypothetical protein, partial [Streptomyces sp. NRRL WC-3618]|uniref:hypothetical protein n=1 Tax=Streptomyces sp. NRRL WC-3618 TaxID=1519490 RepID=UPI001F4362F9